MLPYKDIQNNPERKWHRQLLDRLVTPGVDDEELDEIWDSLAQLDDARTYQPLLDILVNTSYPDPVRERATWILSNFADAVLPEIYRPWFTSSDPVLQDAALSFCDWTDADIILPIARDPEHPWHKNAIGKMVFGYERPEHHQIVIAAMSHPNPEVREWAAGVLMWEEPVAAEKALLAATEDPVAAVVEAACDTLQYYPTQRVYRRIKAMEGYSSEYIRNDLIIDLRDPARQAHLRRWLAPIWDMLEVTGEELAPRERYIPLPHEPALHYATSEVEKFLDDLDTSAQAVRDYFYEMDWLAIPEADRDGLARKFITHPDHVTREYSTRPLETWQHADGLVALFHDSKILVRKSATYHLSQLRTPSREIAAMLWDRLNATDLRGVHSYEILDAYVVHADPDEARERLVDMAGDRGQTETLRRNAVANLQEMKASREVQSLLPLVLEPPSVTWALHVILLDAALELNLKPPSLKQYLEVDHAHIQTAIAPFVD